MSVNQANSISSLSIAHILSKTQSIIRNNGMTNALLPLKCQQIAMQMFAEPFNAKFGASSNNKPQISPQRKDQKNLKFDNLTVKNCKVFKYDFDNQNKQSSNNIKQNGKQQIYNGKFKRDLSSRKSQKRPLLTTSNTARKINDMRINFNNFINKNNYSDCQNQSQLQQTLDINRKNTIRTAAVTSRTQKKYFQINQQINSTRNDKIYEQQKNIETQHQEQTKRKIFFQRLQKQKYEKKISENIQQKLSIYRRSLQMQLQQAKLGQTQPFKIKKPNQPNQIISYQSLQDGNLLTNRSIKPFRKTIQNIIHLKHQQGLEDNFIKKYKNKQITTCKKNIHHQYGQQNCQNSQQDEFKRFQTMNLNYNNSGRRQLSLIPYLTINSGVRISQKYLQVTICRNQPPQNISRQKFIQTSKGFRSFSYKKNQQNTADKNKFMTIDLNRKNYRATNSIIQNQTKKSFRQSILWRPKTSRQLNKIKLINQQYAKEMLIGMA